MIRVRRSLRPAPQGEPLSSTRRRSHRWAMAGTCGAPSG